MRPITSRFLPLLMITLGLPSAWGQSGPDFYTREYSLRSLDARVAELLVSDLCAEHGRKAAVCKVQIAQRRQLIVIAPQEVHTRIVRMLVERDQEESQAQGFQIVLVRASAEGRAGAVPRGEIQKALDAVKELFPYKSFEVVDRGLIRTADRGTTRLGDAETAQFDVHLRHLSTVTRMDGRELTVELQLNQARAGGQFDSILSSVLTLREGETVVAGSSRLATGSGTLLVLLTSLPADYDR